MSSKQVISRAQKALSYIDKVVADPSISDELRHNLYELKDAIFRNLGHLTFLQKHHPSNQAVEKQAISLDRILQSKYF